MSWRFKPGDFRDPLEGTVQKFPQGWKQLADIANALLDQWLSESTVVYKSSSADFWKEYKLGEPTHKALLIRIERLEQCQHPPEKVKQRIDRRVIFDVPGADMFFECECGQKVVPNSFVVPKGGE